MKRYYKRLRKTTGLACLSLVENSGFFVPYVPSLCSGIPRTFLEPSLQTWGKKKRAYLSHMGDCVEPPPKHRARWKPSETITERPSPFVRFLVLFGSPAMNCDHAVSWGRRVWVWVSDIGRVGHTGSGGWPTEIEKKQKTSVLLFGLGGGPTKTHMCDK